MASEEQDERLTLARRKLLKATVYVAPAIASAVAVRKAHAQVSCSPSDACPPTTGGCSPDTGVCTPDNPPCGPDTTCKPGR